MKKNLMHFVVMLSLITGSAGAVELPYAEQRRAVRERLAAKKDVLQQKVSAGKEKLVSRFKIEQDLMKKGLAAAKKRHIQKQSLSNQEKLAYDATLKRGFGGSVAALLAAIGIGVASRRAAPKDRDFFTETRKDAWGDSYKVSYHIWDVKYDPATGRYTAKGEMVRVGSHPPPHPKLDITEWIRWQAGK